MQGVVNSRCIGIQTFQRIERYHDNSSTDLWSTDNRSTTMSGLGLVLVNLLSVGHQSVDELLWDRIEQILQRK